MKVLIPNINIDFKAFDFITKYVSGKKTTNTNELPVFSIA